MYELFLKDNFSAANKLGETILKTNATHEATLLLLGQIALQRKQRERARERYNKTLETYPTSSTARVGRADASFGKKTYEAALEDYLFLYENARKNFPYMTKLGNTYAALQLPHIALKYYQKAVNIAPQDIESRFALTRHLLKLRHYKEAYSQIQATKDRYYHHKSSYRPSVFEEITQLEQQINKHLHGRGKKTTNNK
jgi:tetratricopeptide (TPR) repeat protein